MNPVEAARYLGYREVPAQILQDSLACKITSTNLNDPNTASEKRRLLTLFGPSFHTAWS